MHKGRARVSSSGSGPNTINHQAHVQGLHVQLYEASVQQILFRHSLLSLLAYMHMHTRTVHVDEAVMGPQYTRTETERATTPYYMHAHAAVEARRRVDRVDSQVQLYAGQPGDLTPGT